MSACLYQQVKECSEKAEIKSAPTKGGSGGKPAAKPAATAKTSSAAPPSTKPAAKKPAGKGPAKPGGPSKSGGASKGVSQVVKVPDAPLLICQLFYDF